MIKVDLPSAPYSFSANSYILTSGNECCIIDPAVPYSQSLYFGNLKYIILTHCHFDHILEIDSWVKATGAKVLVSRYDGKGLSDPRINCYYQFFNSEKGYSGEYGTLADKDLIVIGEDKLCVMECPGHTPGSIALVAQGFAIVGDTVFAGGGYGRCDLPGGNYVLLRKSIDKLMSLPEETVLYCGHGPQTTVREYKASIIF